MDWPAWLASFLAINNIADLLAIIGFGITSYVALTVRRIQRDYVSRAVLPNIRDKLEEKAQFLGDCLDVESDVQPTLPNQTLVMNRVNEALNQMEPMLRHLIGQLGWTHRKTARSAKLLLERVQTHNRKATTDISVGPRATETCRPIYNQLRLVIEEIDLHLKTREIERR